MWQKDDRIRKSPLKFYVYYYSDLSGDCQASIITELWRLSVVFLCYFMAHEHLLKEHTYLHVASGDTPILEYRRLRSYISKLVTSRFFQKWCSSGVVSALLLQRTTDFTGFFRTFRDIAVADKQYFYHVAFLLIYYNRISPQIKNGPFVNRVRDRLFLIQLPSLCLRVLFS